jgi:hypothetical protein
MGLEGLAEEDYCYLTTTGRVSGEPREIEIWFGLVLPQTASRPLGRGATLYSPRAHGRLLFDKYSERYGGDLDNWRRTALPLAVDFGVAAPP